MRAATAHRPKRSWGEGHRHASVGDVPAALAPLAFTFERSDDLIAAMVGLARRKLASTVVAAEADLVTAICTGHRGTDAVPGARDPEGLINPGVLGLP